MLREWFSGSPPEEAVTPAPAAAEERADPVVAPSRAEQRDRDMRRKLQSASKSEKVTHQHAVTYDMAFRGIQRTLMEGHQFEIGEGLTLSAMRGMHNLLVGSKWRLATPQTSAVEWTIQMNGFGDVTTVAYSPMRRWQLLNQRTFPNGALMVLQCASQTQMGMGTMGSFYAMGQYPLLRGGWAQLQYVKQQFVSTSFMQEVLHGLYLGSQLTYEMPTGSTNVSYCASVRGPDKTLNAAAEVKPSSGEWKVGISQSEWSTDTEIACQLEQADVQNSKECSLMIGMKCMQVGGGSVAFSIRNFHKLRANVTLVYGGSRTGINQVQVSYDAGFNAMNGKYTHGLSVTC